MKTKVDLLSIVAKRTQETTKESRVKFSTNENLVEILLDNPLTRKEIIDQLVVARIKSQIGEANFNDMSPDEQIETIDKLKLTSKNGLDTSVSKSKNKSAFWKDPKVADYRLVKDANKYVILKNEQ